MKNKKTITAKIKLGEFINDYIQEVTRCLMLLDKERISDAIDLLTQAYKDNRRIYILGNGGSASTASHMACDLGKGTLQRVYDNSEKRIRVVSLSDNVALITAFANDLSFDDIFVQQLRNLVEPGDVVIVLSGSGNSKNIVNTVKYAKSRKAKTIGLLGFKTGGKLKTIVDCAIIVDSNHYGPIEDIHLILNHLISSWIAKTKHIYDKNNYLSDNKSRPFS